ncbi:MAG: gluconolaconase, partial [Chitinophagaceae bacterium]
MKGLGIVMAMSFALSVHAQTPRITFKAPLLYPEGIVHDKNTDRFFVSSVTTGTIGTVGSDGTYKVFYEDSTLKSSFGMKTDGKKLWVCTGDPTYSKFGGPSTRKKLIRLIGLDMAGKKTDDIDCSALLNGNHFLNDLALDDNGNKYLTDSYSPVVYKIDNNGKAEIFVQDSLLKGKDAAAIK